MSQATSQNTETYADQSVLLATVESLLSDRPKVFRTENGRYVVALYGLLIPLRMFVSAFIGGLYNNPQGAYRYANIGNDLDDEIRSLHQEVKASGRFAALFVEQPGKAVVEAVLALLTDMRKSDNPKEEIRQFIEEFDQAYQEVYILPETQDISKITHQVLVVSDVTPQYSAPSYQPVEIIR